MSLTTEELTILENWVKDLPAEVIINIYTNGRVTGKKRSIAYRPFETKDFNNAQLAALYELLGTMPKDEEQVDNPYLHISRVVFEGIEFLHYPVIKSTGIKVIQDLMNRNDDVQDVLTNVFSNLDRLESMEKFDISTGECRQERGVRFGLKYGIFISITEEVMV